MNSSNSLEKIRSEIKNTIKENLTQNPVTYKGGQKKISKLKEWWKEGVEFPEGFDLSSVVEQGIEEITVRFNCWAIIEVNEKYSEQVNIDGYYGPINISIGDKEYIVDTSKGNLSRLSIGRNY